MINKKSQIFDLIYLAFVLFMIAVVGLTVYKVIEAWNDETSGIIDEENRAYTQTFEDRLPDYLQQIFIVVLFGVSIVSLVSAFLVNSHPIFYGFFMVLLGFLSWFNAMYANLWYSFSSDAAFGTLANSLPIINTIIRYYPLVLFVLGLIIGITMMAKGE